MNDEVNAQAMGFLKKLTPKQMVIGGYLLIAVLFTIYRANWGPMAFKGVAYNFGQCLFWPTIVFPELGSAVTGLAVLGLVAWVIFF